MKLNGFTPIWYIIALIMALVSQKSDACGDEYQAGEPEPIKITIPVM